MSYPIVTDIIRRVQNEDGIMLDVRPNPEAPEFGVVLTNRGDKDSEEYSGKVDIAFSTEYAKEIGQALIDCAREIEEKRNG
jgi:hypothetical protein